LNTSSVSERESSFATDGAPSDAFVGRRRELGILMRLLTSGRGLRGSVIVEGEAGIGKTRLVSEFLEVGRRQGLRVLQGCCYQVQEAGAYFPFRQMLRQAQDDASALEEHLDRADDDTSGASHRADLGEDARGRRTEFLRHLTNDILREVAAEDTILCVEDIHWADPGSLLLLNNLVDLGAEGVLIICTARMDETLGPDARQLVAQIERKSRPIVLKGLGRSGLRKLVENIAGPGCMTLEETEDLRSFTGGNPLWLKELLLHLRQTGLLGRHTVGEALRRTRTPDALAHVIDSRLRSLPKAASRVLAAASVVGTEFSVAMAARAAGESDVAAAEELEVGVTARILQPVDSLECPRYRFAHPLYASSLYDSLAASERRGLHRRIAEAGRSGEVPLTLSELARHHALGLGVAGGRTAVDYCRSAAGEAEHVLAYETAAVFWELALRCTRPRSRRARAELYRRLGWALWAAGKWRPAADAWREAAGLLEQLRDLRGVGEVALALGDLYRWRQELAESERWVQRALQVPLPDFADRARALALLGNMRCVRGQHRAGRKFLEDAKALWTESGRDPSVAFWLSQGYGVNGDHAQAHDTARQGYGEAQRRGSSRAMALLAASLVTHELSRLQVDPARSYVRVVKEAVDPTDATTLIRSLVCEAYLLGYEGNWRGVARLCEEWMAQARLAGRYQVAAARFAWAEAQVPLGDTEAALREMVRALPDLEHMRPASAMCLARASLQLGFAREAASLVGRYSREVIESAQSAAGRAVLGEVASCLDEEERWQECYDSLAQERRHLVVLCSPISIQRVLGRLAGRLKRWPAAFAHFDTAVEQLAKGQARWELAQTCLDYAEMRRARRRRGDLRKAAALELQAKTILAELGIQHSPRRRVPKVSTDGNRYALTGRELEVLGLVAEGRRNQEIAEDLGLSHRTVERHLENAFGKIGVVNRTEAVVQAVQEGLVGPLKRTSGIGDGARSKGRQADERSSEEGDAPRDRDGAASLLEEVADL
jgi:DNA-binding CsgD family transcriptional regulator